MPLFNLRWTLVPLPKHSAHLRLHHMLDNFHDRAFCAKTTSPMGPFYRKVSQGRFKEQSGRVFSHDE
jgi:carbamate kinase